MILPLNEQKRERGVGVSWGWEKWGNGPFFPSEGNRKYRCS